MISITKHPVYTFHNIPEGVVRVITSLAMNDSRESLNKHFEQLGATPNLVSEQEWEEFVELGKSLHEVKTRGG